VKKGVKEEEKKRRKKKEEKKKERREGRLNVTIVLTTGSGSHHFRSLRLKDNCQLDCWVSL